MAAIQTSLPIPAVPNQQSQASVLDQLSAWDVLIPKREEVIAYLTRFSDVGAVLPALSAELRRALGTDTELSLEVNHDPEIVDEYLKLVARRDNYESGFMDAIYAVNRRFDDVLEETEGYLMTATDFHRRKGTHGV